MNKLIPTAAMIALLSVTSLPAIAGVKQSQSPEEAKRDAALKAVRVSSKCNLSYSQLNYAMPYARQHGVSKAEAVAKMQSIASDFNRSVVRYMAIQAWEGPGDVWKEDAVKYCIKQLSKRTDQELQESSELLDGGNAMTLFVE